MDADREDLEKILMAVSHTHEEEISCDECFELLDRFVEAELSGLDAARAMPLVEDHLQKCGDCREEFEALLGALRAEEGSGPVGRLWSRLRRSLGSGLPEEKRMDDDQDLRATRRGSAARKRARHRRLPQLRRLRPLLHEEIRTVVSFDENLARWAESYRLSPVEAGLHKDESRRAVVALRPCRGGVVTRVNIFGAEGTIGVAG